MSGQVPDCSFGAEAHLSPKDNALLPQPLPPKQQRSIAKIASLTSRNENEGGF